MIEMIRAQSLLPSTRLAFSAENIRRKTRALFVFRAAKPEVAYLNYGMFVMPSFLLS